MSTLSVVMIVKNEAHCIAECLESVRAIADEIVVGDTGSDDDTIAIARGYGARVLNVEWRNDFAYARNCVLNEAKGDWLLTLDADEVLDHNGAVRIRAIVDSNEEGVDGVEVTLANYCDEPRSWRWTPCARDDPYARGYAGYVAVGLVRLYRNGRGIEYREAVHENLAESLAENDAQICVEEIKIHHYGFDPSKARNRAKRQFYLGLARKKVRERPDEAKAWFDLASASNDCGDLETAECAARKALGLHSEFVDAAAILANLYLERGDYRSAERLLDGFIKAGIAPPIFMSARGAAAAAQGRLEEAREWLEKALVADPKHIIGRLSLARVLDQCDDSSAARNELEEAHAAAPTLQEVGDRIRAFDLREAGETLFRGGDYREALNRFVEALKLDPEDALLHNDAGVAMSALERPDAARDSFERALKLAPGLVAAQRNLDELES